jgi:hypothetical protein
MTYWTKYYLKMSLPLLLFLGIMLVTISSNLVKDYLRKGRRISLRLDRKPMWSIFCFINAAMFTFVISNVVEPFNCTLQSNGSYLMTHNPSTPCYGYVWRSYFPSMIFFLLIYGVCGPALIIYFFWINRHSPERQPFQSRFSAITSPYKRRFFYWEIFVMFKRTLFMVSGNFLSSNGASYLVKYCVSVLILLISGWMEMLAAPYSESNFNMCSVV